MGSSTRQTQIWSVSSTPSNRSTKIKVLQKHIKIKKNIKKSQKTKKKNNYIALSFVNNQILSQNFTTTNYPSFKNISIFIMFAYTYFVLKLLNSYNMASTFK